jgi:gliding motility-associated-like protein
LTNTFNSVSTLAGAHFPVGVSLVTWTATDNAGLTASCNFTVTVIDDVKPVALCKNIDVYLDLTSGNVSIGPEDVDNGSWDNTAIGSMTIDRSSFTCSNLGPNNVTLTVTDIYNNVGTCTSTVTVHYAVLPNPVVTPSADVICNKETINLSLTNNIPGTTWTWTANPSPEISGASNDNTGLNSSITQTLNNSDHIVHNVIYNIVPRVYGTCDLTTVSAEIWVNPEPEVQVSPTEIAICYGETANISVENPNVSVRGQWMYDLTVVPDPEITGNTISGLYTNPTNLEETLFNNDIRIHKVVYNFTPRIIPDDGGSVCSGNEETVTIWVHPRLKYSKELSDYHGYNISCFGKSNGYIRISPSPETAELEPLIFNWSGPEGFTSSDEDISGLKAGHYIMSITDKNKCTVTEEFDLTEPDKLGMTINTSTSSDGTYNINCADGKTGIIDVSAFNYVGQVDYLWENGQIGSTRTNLSAGDYKIVIKDSNGCLAESNVTLTAPEKISIAFDISESFCPEKPDGEIRVIASGGVSGDYTYLWSDNSTQKDILNIPAGLYSVTVTDMNGCSAKDIARLNGMNKICLIIPEAFSPNGDLINDIWNIENTDLYPEIEITIYNRWGQALWKSEKGYPISWDGRSRGEELPIDSYHYAIDLHNGSQTIIGAITIIR